MKEPRPILVLAAKTDFGAAGDLAKGLAEARVRALEPAPGEGATRVAAALVAAEGAIAEEAPAGVVVCGSGPEVGAAVLSAAKLGVPVALLGADEEGASEDPAVLAGLGGAIAVSLAGLTVSGDPQAAAGEIRAWAETYTLSP